MLHGSGVSPGSLSAVSSYPSWPGSRMPGRAWRVASVISAKTVACRPGLFHRICRSKAWNRRALSSRGQAGQDVPGAAAAGRAGSGSAALGVVWARAASWASSLLAFVVELGEPGADPGAHRGGGGVGRGRRGVLRVPRMQEFWRGLDPLEPGGQGGGLGVAVGGGGGVGGGELGGEQVGAAGAEDVLGEEQADDLVQAGFGGLDGAGVAGVVGGVAGVGGVVRALVVHVQAGPRAVGQAGHPAAAVPAPDPAPVGVGPGRGRVGAQAGRRRGWCRARRRCAGRRPRWPGPRWRGGRARGTTATGPGGRGRGGRCGCGCRP